MNISNLVSLVLVILFGINKITDMHKLIKFTLLFALAILFVYQSPSQEITYNVLPDSNRNELFHSYLMNQVYQYAQTRKTAVEQALQSNEQIRERQQQLTNNFKQLVGNFPPCGSLNSQLIETIYLPEYRIEKIIFEGIPNHHITANFYLPATDSTLFPTVLVTCGHYPDGKSNPVLQKLCILLAQNGIAAFIVDPVCQGERYQVVDETTGQLKYIGGSGTSEHTLLDVGAELNGTSLLAYELTDNRAAIDYLYSRVDVVDTSRIGCAGGSGGGAQATYLSAYDKRIKVAVVASFLMNKPTLFSTIGPQTCSQNLSSEALYGLDHPDYIAMFAPKPFMIIAATNDFFDIHGTRESYAETSKVYHILGLDNHLSYFETNDGHDWTILKRQKAVQWFKTWFYNDSSSVTEIIDNYLLNQQLTVTKTGQVMTTYKNEVNLTDLNIQKAQNNRDLRTQFWNNHPKDSCISMVKELIHFENYQPCVVEITQKTSFATYTIEYVKIMSGSDVPVTGILFTPKINAKSYPVVLYVGGRGKATVAGQGGLIEKEYLDKGYMVLAVDVRGFGETLDNPSANHKKYQNDEFRNAVISLYLGKTLIGQRVADIQKSLDIISQLAKADTTNITLIGVDRAAITALHAAAFDQRITSIVLQNCDSSFLGIVEHPTINNSLTQLVPNALSYYDLPDLYQAIEPRVIKSVQIKY